MTISIILTWTGCHRNQTGLRLNLSSFFVLFVIVTHLLPSYIYFICTYVFIHQFCTTIELYDYVMIYSLITTCLSVLDHTGNGTGNQHTSWYTIKSRFLLVMHLCKLPCCWIYANVSLFVCFLTFLYNI